LLLELVLDLVHKVCTVAGLLLEQLEMLLEHFLWLLDRFLMQIFDWQKSLAFLAGTGVGLLLELFPLLLERFRLLLEQILIDFCLAKYVRFSRKFLGIFLLGFLANPGSVDQ
jgi:hypothetical protein